jgi:hypothetical protein
MDIKKAVIMTLLAVVSLAGCTAGSFRSVWRAPNEPPWSIQDKKIVVLVLTDAEAVRRNSEDLIAGELNLEGAKALMGYRTLSGDLTDEMSGLLSSAKDAGMDGAFVMRAFSSEPDVRYRSGIRVGIGYGRFGGWYGRYHDHWHDPPEPFVTIETRFYDLAGKGILWTGVSEYSYSYLDEKALLKVARASITQMFKEGILAR